jgi:hypothetical protein
MAATKARLMRKERLGLTPGERLVKFYRENPVWAAKDLLNIDLIWLQRICLEELWWKSFTCMSLGRGVSKSFLFSVFSLLKAMLYPESKIGIITPVYRQVKDFIFNEYIRPWSQNCKHLKDSMDGNVHIGNDRCVIRFRNGAYVEGLPVGHDGGKVRGRRYHVVCADEYAQHVETVLKRAIRPMLNIKHPGRDNQYHIASSPYFKSNHFWPQYLHILRMVMKKPDKYGLMEFDYRDVNITVPSKLKKNLVWRI